MIRRAWLIGRQATFLGLVVSVLALALISDCRSERTYSFKVTSANGPVCKAYAKLLNTTHFDKSPQCGLPDSGNVRGFQPLNRSGLLPGEIASLFRPVYAFTLIGEQPRATDLSEFWVQNADASMILRLAENGSIKAWKYAPPLDVANTGAPQNIVVWQGYGASPSLDECDSVMNFKSVPSLRIPTNQLAYVLSPDNSEIDEKETARLFGHPAGTSRKTARLKFLELGWSMNIFQYKNVVYIAAFYGDGGDFHGSDRTDRLDATSYLENVLAVTRRENGAQKLMCELLMTTGGTDEAID